MADFDHLNVKSSASGVERSAVDSDNPWPGLSSFTEDLRSFFFGREKETEELVRLVRRNTLTVLFGQSGLGKSSLLQAGVFPLLREADFLPLYLRLDHDPASVLLADQVKAALVEAFKLAGADAPVPRADESLWEYFHRKDIDIWSAKNRLLTPVLAFDQFEEIFTLGRADETRRERGRAFLTELADLVENRPPADLRAKFDSGDMDTARYNFDKPSCQVILSLREDFLPDLESLKTEMRSLMHNRMRVKRLTGTQALEIVTRPAPHLLAEGVAERVVEFVAGARGGSAERLAEMEVEPALLSVICRELNQRRRTLGQEQITIDLVSGNRREILIDFYERSVSDLPVAMREYVEDHLLTKSGFRDNLALETVLEAPGVTRALVDTLVSRRLLRIEDRLGVQRIELTHDVLADVISGSRDSRQQRLALEQARARERNTRRRLWLLRGIAAGLVLLLAGVSRMAYQAVQARNREAVKSARSELEFSSQLLERGDAPAAIARVVRAAQSDPTNPVTGSRLISALTRRNWPRWEDTGAKLPSPADALFVSPDGKTVCVFGRDNVLRLLDAHTLQAIKDIRLPASVVNGAFANRKPNLMALALADNTAIMVDCDSGTHHLVPCPGDMNGWSTMALSPDGKSLAIATASTTMLIDASAGKVITEIVNPEAHNPSGLNFSADSARLILTDWDYGFEIFQVATGEVTVPWVHPSPYNISGAGWGDFSPDGKTAILCWFQGTALFDTFTGKRIGPLLQTGAQSDFALFDADGRRVITTSQDRTARIWDTATQKELVPPLRHGAVVDYAELSRDGHTLLVRSHDGFVHLWDTATGTPLVEPTLNVPSSRSISLDPSGTRVLFAAPDNRLMALGTAPSAVHPLVWMPATGGFKFSNGAVINSITGFHPDQPRTLVHMGETSRESFSLDTGKPASKPAPVPSGVQVWDLDRRGNYLVSSPESGWAVWQDKGNGPEKIRDLVDVPQDILFGYFDEKNDSIFITTGLGANPKTVRVWRRSTGQPAGPTISLATPIIGDSITFSPDGKRIALGTRNAVGIWDVATGRQVVFCKTNFEANYHVAMFSPDGKVFATGTFLAGTSLLDVHAEARLWDAQTGQPISPIISHRESIDSVAFSPDSRLIAISSVDGSVDVLSTSTGQAVCPPLVHGGALATSGANSYNAPARFLGTDSILSDSLTKLSWWDASSGLPLMEPLPSGPELIKRFEVDASGKFVMLNTDHGRVHIWPLPPRYVNTPVPGWLPRLATAFAGVRLNENGVLVPVEGGYARAHSEFAAIRDELAALPADAPYAEWGRWVLADPATRPIAPGLSLTFDEAKGLGLTD